jgi:hypothetical protein
MMSINALTSAYAQSSFETSAVDVGTHVSTSSTTAKSAGMNIGMPVELAGSKRPAAFGNNLFRD